MRRFIGFAVAVLAVTFSARAAIVAGPEREVATPSLGFAYGAHSVEAVASDGTNFLVAWTNANGSGWTLYLSVVSPNGTPLTDPHDGIRINAGRAVSIVWMGDAYLVSWSDDSGVVAVARVTREGQFDGEPVAVADDFPDLSSDALAWDGHRALLTFRDTRTQKRKFVLLDGHGQIVRDDLTVPFSSAPSVVVSAIPGRFLAVWSQTGTFAGNPNSSVFTTSIDDDGNAVSPAVAIIANVPAYLSSLNVAPDGDRVAVAFVNYATSTLRRAYVTPSTLAVETLPEIAVFSAGPTGVRLVRSGGEVLAYWPVYRDGALLLETMSFATAALRESRIGPAVAFDVRAASNGQSILAVWSDRRVSVNSNDYAQLLNAALLDASGSTVKASDTQVALSPSSQGAPVIASAGAVSLVAWMDEKATVRGDLLVRRVDSRGVAIDAAPAVIDTNVPAGYSPVVGFTGQVWIVAYTTGEGSRMSYRRVSTNGVVLDATPKDLGVVYALFAANAKTSVFAGQTSNGIAAVRFTPAGEKIDPDPLLITARSGFLYSIAAADDEFLAVWGEGSNWWQFPSPNYRDIYGARLDGSGAPIDAAPIAIATTKSDEGNAVVASTGRDFLVAYIDFDTQLFSPGVLKAKRVLHEGVAGAEKVIAESAETVSMAASSGRYFVVWDKVTLANTRDAEMRAVTIDDDGNLLETPSILDRTELQPRLAPVPGGVLLGYTKVFEAGATRAILRPLTVVMTRNRGTRH